MLLSGLYKY